MPINIFSPDILLVHAVGLILILLFVVILGSTFDSDVAEQKGSSASRLDDEPVLPSAMKISIQSKTSDYE